MPMRFKARKVKRDMFRRNNTNDYPDHLRICNQNDIYINNRLKDMYERYIKLIPVQNNRYDHPDHVFGNDWDFILFLYKKWIDVPLCDNPLMSKYPTIFQLDRYSIEFQRKVLYYKYTKLIEKNNNSVKLKFTVKVNLLELDGHTPIYEPNFYEYCMDRKLNLNDFDLEFTILNVSTTGYETNRYNAYIDNRKLILRRHG